MKKYKMKKSKWFIYVVTYGTFLFEETELEAEEMRQHKAVWEGGIGSKRLATDEEIKNDIKPKHIEISERVVTPNSRLYATFTGMKYNRNTTGYKKDNRYEIQIFEIDGKIILRGWDKKENRIDENNIIVYNNFSSFLNNWTSIQKNTSPNQITLLLNQNKTIKQLMSIR